MKAVEITNVVGCPNNCVYCPQKTLLGVYEGNKVMSMDMLKTCVNSLNPKKVGVHFSGFGEPFINPNFVEMVKYLKDTGYEVWLFTTLRGANIEKLKKISSYGIDRIIVNLINEKEQTVKLDDKYFESLSFVVKNDFGKKTFLKTKYTPKRSLDIVKGCQVDSLVTVSRGGLLKGWGFSRRTGKRLWCLREDQPVVLPNGEVVACSNDYGMNIRLGNLLSQSMAEIDQGEAKKNFIRDLRGRKIDICNNCEYAHTYFFGCKTIYKIRVFISSIYVFFKRKIKKLISKN
jgi:radical SAM protein with 4Fe4S-binding SPASM domain